MSARDAMAAMLDELMGPKRNVKLGEDTKVTFDDPKICTYYLVGFCPHDMFINTKADLGPCNLVHDDNLRRMYPTSDEFRKLGFEKHLLRFLVYLEEDNNRRIRKNKEKLVGMDHLGKHKNNEDQTRTRKEIETVEDELKALIRDAEDAGNNGNVTKCQELVAKSEELQALKSMLVQKLDKLIDEANPLNPPNVDDMLIKPMEVCEICGSMLIVNDAQNRIDEHLTGKMHTGFQKIRTMIDELKEILKQREDEEESKREERRRERGERRRSGSRDRDRRRRSRSRSRSPYRSRHDRDRRDHNRRGHESSSSASSSSHRHSTSRRH